MTSSENETWVGVTWGNGAPGDRGWQDIDRFTKVGERRDRWRASLLVESEVATRVFLEAWPSLPIAEVIKSVGIEKFLESIAKRYGDERAAFMRDKIQTDSALIAAKAAIGPEVPTAQQYKEAGEYAVEIAYALRAKGGSDKECRNAASAAFNQKLNG
jgi:hypothetical protein